MTCQPGCMVFDGGERKHRRDCEHYPESLTKLWHDAEAGYVAEIERLRSALRQVAKPGYGLQGIDEDHGHDPNAYNYHAMIYWKSQAEQMQIAARSALNI